MFNQYFPPEAQQVEKLVGAYDVIMKEKDSFTKECKEKVKDFRYHYTVVDRFIPQLLG